MLRRTPRIKRNTAQKVAEYMSKSGGLMTEQNYATKLDVPTSLHNIQKLFGSWDKCMNTIQAKFPDQWAKLTAPKPAAPKPKVAEKVAAAVKPVVKKEKKEDGKDL